MNESCPDNADIAAAIPLQPDSIEEQLPETEAPSTHLSFDQKYAGIRRSLGYLVGVCASLNIGVGIAEVQARSEPAGAGNLCLGAILGFTAYWHLKDDL